MKESDGKSQTTFREIHWLYEIVLILTLELFKRISVSEISNQ